MIRVSQLKLSPGHSLEELYEKTAKLLHIKKGTDSAAGNPQAVCGRAQKAGYTAYICAGRKRLRHFRAEMRPAQ